MSSIAEAEFGALYINTKQAALMQQMLAEMGHAQPPMPIETDNSMAYGNVMNNIIPKATKVMDMHFHWLCDHGQQKQF